MGRKRLTLNVLPKLPILLFIVVCILAPCSWAQVATGPRFPTRVLGSIAAIGDSITQAYDAKYSDFLSCRYTDNPDYSFSTNTASNTTVSIAEWAISYKGSGVTTANFGSDGAKMSAGMEQAQAAKTWVLTQAAPRLITVFLGHNDICGGEADKYRSSCPRASQDPNNYCRTSAFHYEQRMRQMLDVLITIPDSQIAIIHPIRVSQLCNFAKEKVIEEWWLTRRCEDLWAMPNLFGEDGICPSLTSCSIERVADAYTTWVAYREIGNRVVEEYNLYGAGESIPYNSAYSTGNVVRAAALYLQTTDVLGSSKFNYRDPSGNPQLSVCECYHPSKYGQNLLASLLWNGVSCSTATPCCNDSVVGDSDFNKGLCYNYTTSGSMNGLWYTATADYFDIVQKVYIGYYQRPADPAGLLWWAERLKEANGNLDTIIDAFAKSDESKALYGEVDNTTISNVVDGIYMGLLSRTPSQVENDYWSGLFREGKISAAAIMLIMLNGAQNEDLVTINNKLAASNFFTGIIDPGLDGADFQVTYLGESDAAAARSFLASVTWDSATVPTVDETTAYMKNYVADPGDPILHQ